MDIYLPIAGQSVNALLIIALGFLVGLLSGMFGGGVDMKMGSVMIVGGLLGSFVGAAMFRALQSSGQIDVVIGLLYVLILGSIGFLMLRDSLVALGYLGSS